MAALSVCVDDRGRWAVHQAGWSWLAATALPLWAIHRRLWRTLLALSIALPALHGAAGAVIGRAASESAQGPLALAWLAVWSVACGALAERWHLHCLRRAGFRVVAADRPRAWETDP